MPRARTATLAAVAAAARSDPHLFDPRRDLVEAVASLRELAGIGEWTAQYIAMRALGESDAFLAGDVGLRRQIAKHETQMSTSQLLDRAERWRPWRAYATLHLWMADSDTKHNISISRKDTYNALTA